MISHFFIRRMKLASVISIIITLVGLLSILIMPINQFPNIIPTQIMVSTMYPGASSEIAEEMVTNILEEKINGIEDMMFIQSSSYNGGACSITITFKPGINSDIALVGVQSRVSEAQPFLPKEVRNIGISVRKRSTNILMGVTVNSSNNKHDATYLSNYASLSIKNNLSRIDGVGEVEVFGNKDYSMRIWLNPDKMFALGVTSSDIVLALQQQNISIVAGSLGQGPDSDSQLIYTVNSPKILSNVAEFNQIIVRSNEDGSFVYLQDVAKIELGSESYSALGKYNGSPTSFLMVYTHPEANAIKTADNVKIELEKLKKQFPEGLDYQVKFDTTKFIKVSLYELLKTILEATLLVIAVVFLFLQNWRATLIPIIAIPVSLIGAFCILDLFNFSINTISLFGLVLAVGLVVDDAIIVIENVDRLITQEKLSPLEAAKKSMTQITTPIIATTLILLAVFIPVTLTPGIVGGIYREFAVTISAALVISMINALTLSPVLCAVLLPKEGITHVPWLIPFNNFLEATSNKYTNMLRWLLPKRWKNILFFLLVVILAVYMHHRIPKGFLPNEDMGFFIAEIQLPVSASNTRTDQVLSKVYEQFKQIPKVDSVITLSGLGFMSGAGSNKGSIITILKDWDERTDPEFSQDNLMKIAQGILNDIPEAIGYTFGFPTIPGVGKADGFDFVLKDMQTRSLQALSDTAQSFSASANKQPEISRVFSSWNASEPQYKFTIDYAKLKKLNIPIEEVQATFATQLASMYVNDFSKFGKTYKVTTLSQSQFRVNSDAFDNFYLRSYTGNMVPLSEIITITESVGAQSISHYNLKRSVQLLGSAAPGYSTGDTIEVMERLAKNLTEGFSYEWSGQSLEEILTKNISLILFILSIIFAYLFLVAQYESWSLPVAVLLVLPFAFLGTMLGIYAFSFLMPELSNDIYAQIGLLLLIGLSAKMAILIIDFAIHERNAGKTISDSIVNASRMRFRAVLMTSFAFIIGLLPLVFSHGAGANSRKIIGVSVCSGMLIATIFGLIFVPFAYSIIEKMTSKETVEKAEKIE